MTAPRASACADLYPNLSEKALRNVCLPRRLISRDRLTAPQPRYQRSTSPAPGPLTMVGAAPPYRTLDGCSRRHPRPAHRSPPVTSGGASPPTSRMPGRASRSSPAGPSPSPHSPPTGHPRRGPTRPTSPTGDPAHPDRHRRAPTAVDVLVNNAGTESAGHLTDLTADDLENLVALNLQRRALSRGAAGHDRARSRPPRQHLVAGGGRHLPELATYGATKAGLTHLRPACVPTCAAGRSAPSPSRSARSPRR